MYAWLAAGCLPEPTCVAILGAARRWTGRPKVGSLIPGTRVATCAMVTMEPRPVDDNDDVIGALVAASWPLVAVAARALAAVEPRLTLAQYRILALLDERGAVDPAAVAPLTGLDPYAAWPVVEQLRAAGLLERIAAKGNEREDRWRLTPTGRRVVHGVAEHWRRQLARLAQATPPQERVGPVAALRALSGSGDSLA